MSKKTPLYDCHRESGAQLVDFSGWEMPLHYGSQIEEHLFVRQAVGLFDVSHMGVLDVTGPGAQDFLRYALANDVAKLKSPGKALYSCMLNEAGGVVDDLIVYRMTESDYRIILNAGNRESDVKWLQSLTNDFDVTLTPRPNLAILALQGPQAIPLLLSILPDDAVAQLNALKPFEFFVDSQGIMIARTGYTGEDGVEIIIPNDLAVNLWKDFITEEVRPCGLGARDTLRLEAGFNLYGADMNEETSPLVSNLSWTVSLKDEARRFVGREALEKEKANGIQQKLVGLVMKEPGVLRNHQEVFIPGGGVGEITSGSFSPSLKHAIALARVPMNTGDVAEVERRGKRVTVEVVKPPFVKK